MDRFSGTLDQLRDLVLLSGFYGDWSEIPYGHLFIAEGGARLNWYTKSGKILYQGKKAEADALRDALARNPWKR
jgi:hypothetical protein